jgi:hypothetical protein
MSAPETGAWIFTLLQVVQFVPLTAWAIWWSVRHKDALPVLALIGGALSGVFFEPIVDHLTQLWWPYDMPLHLYTVFGIHIPAVTTIGYAFFLGLGAWWVWGLIESGRGARGIWLAAALFAVADLIYEIPFLLAGVYEYYGDQAWMVGGFPLTWDAMNFAVPIVGGWMFWFARDRLRSGGSWLALVLPSIAMGWLLFAAAPVALALHADIPQALRWVLGGMTIAICFWSVKEVADVAEREARVVDREPELAGVG